VKTTPIPVGTAACDPHPVIPLPTGVVPATIIVVVIVAMVWLAVSGLPPEAISSLLAAAAAAAGYLVRQLRGQVSR
jgi:hypothetical protein